MKIIYISHVPLDSTYGAGTSFRNQINIINKNKNEVDKILIFYRVSFSQMIKYIYISINYFYKENTLAIPIFCNWDINYDYKHNINILKNDEFILNRFMYYLSSILIRISIEIFRPQIIHLNSHVLSKFWHNINTQMQLTKKRFKVICHVRDMISNLNKDSIKFFSLINYFICIDFATRKRLLKFYPFLDNHSTIIPNPFESIQAKRKLNKFNTQIKDYDLIIGFVGTLIEDKGIDFLINSLSKYKTNKRLLFIIVGDGPLYISLQNKSKKIKNIEIIFTGLINSLSKTNFYEKIDLLVRGDKSFRTGRTVFESLYEGKSVLIPKDFKDEIEEPQLDEFKEIVFLYQARNEKSFINIFDNFVKSYSRISRKPKMSNFSEYRNSLIEIYKGV